MRALGEGPRRGDRHVRLAHVALPRLPGLRGRLPDRRQVRAPDGGDPRRDPGAPPAHRLGASAGVGRLPASSFRTLSGWRCSPGLLQAVPADGRPATRPGDRPARAAAWPPRRGRSAAAAHLVALLRAAGHRPGARRPPEAGRVLRRLHHARRLRRDESRHGQSPGAGRLRRRPARRSRSAAAPSTSTPASARRRRAWPGTTSRRSSGPTPSGSSSTRPAAARPSKSTASCWPTIRPGPSAREGVQRAGPRLQRGRRRAAARRSRPPRSRHEGGLPGRLPPAARPAYPPAAARRAEASSGRRRWSRCATATAVVAAPASTT